MEAQALGPAGTSSGQSQNELLRNDCLMGTPGAGTMHPSLGPEAAQASGACRTWEGPGWALSSLSSWYSGASADTGWPPG